MVRYLFRHDFQEFAGDSAKIPIRSTLRALHELIFCVLAVLYARARCACSRAFQRGQSRDFPTRQSPAAVDAVDSTASIRLRYSYRSASDYHHLPPKGLSTLPAGGHEVASSMSGTRIGLVVVVVMKGEGGVVVVVEVGSLVAVHSSSVACNPTLGEPLRLLPGKHLVLGRSRTLHPGRTVASQGRSS
eukprot:COSAG05_NODE_958_length_6426_cov_7.214003_4_plen_188_part_00